MAGTSVIELFKKIAENEFGYFERLNSVSDIMSKEYPTVSCELNFGEFVELNHISEMAKHSLCGIKSLAIIDPEDGQVIGVLERNTILRCYPKYLETLAEKDDDRNMFSTPLTMMATRPVPKIEATATLLQALNRLVAGQELLLVYDEQNKVVGSLSSIDIIQVMSLYYKVYNNPNTLSRLRLVDLDKLTLDQVFSSGAQTARDVMSRIETLEADASVSNAFQKFRDKNVRQLLYHDQSNDRYGLMTREELLLGLETPQSANSIELSKLFPEPHELKKSNQVFQSSIKNLVDMEINCVEPITRFSVILESMLRTNGQSVLICHDDAIQGVVTRFEALRVFRNLLTFDSWNSISLPVEATPG